MLREGASRPNDVDDGDWASRKRLRSSVSSRSAAGRVTASFCSCGRLAAIACAQLALIKARLRRRTHNPVPNLGRWLQRIVRGYFAYQAIPTKLCGPAGPPLSSHQALAADASAPQPARRVTMRACVRDGRTLAASTSHHDQAAIRGVRHEERLGGRVVPGAPEDGLRQESREDR